VKTESLPPYDLPQLRDLDQPFIFDISVYNRPFRFQFYDTSSPTNYTLLRPDFLILCYDVSKRSTLESLGSKWKWEVESHFNYDEKLPVMVLGLKRDLRREWTEKDKLVFGKGESVMPEEGLGLAQRMRVDKYAECSAVTGELCKEVLEDIAKTAAKSSEGGGKSEGGCTMM
jgi:GTPase SAR1 family protein